MVHHNPVVMLGMVNLEKNWTAKFITFSDATSAAVVYPHAHWFVCVIPIP